MENEHAKTKRRAGIAAAYDWVFLLWVVLVVASAWVFIGAPLLMALASQLTRLRKSRRDQFTLWVIAIAITLYNVVPILVVWLGLSGTYVNEHRFVVG